MWVSDIYIYIYFFLMDMMYVMFFICGFLCVSTAVFLEIPLLLKSHSQLPALKAPGVSCPGFTTVSGALCRGIAAMIFSTIAIADKRQVQVSNFYDQKYKYNQSHCFL